MTYYIFAGDNYYPSGGAQDFRGTARGLAEARLFIEGLRSSANGNYQSCPAWVHVANEDMDIVYEAFLDCNTGDIRGEVEHGD